MRAIATWVREHRPESFLALFVIVNLFAIELVPTGQTIPFHFIWVSFSITYGLRMWRTQVTWLALLAVTLVTGLVLTRDVLYAGLDWGEVTEVPLMAAMFVVMTVHVRRRQRQAETANALAASERRLREEQRQFLREASHLIRTPLTIARGHTELAHESAHGEAREDLTVVLEELIRLESMSGRLLLLSSTSLPDVLRPEPLDVAALLHDVAHRWSASGATRFVVDAHSPAFVCADPVYLQCALDELVENAVKYSDAKARITLRCAKEEGFVQIYVTDEGPGIVAEELPHVFVRDYRGAPSGRPGTGLGLAIVARVTAAHGGAMDVFSTVGEGSTFTMRLPML